jgi:hypothetical protein
MKSMDEKLKTVNKNKKTELKLSSKNKINKKYTFKWVFLNNLNR